MARTKAKRPRNVDDVVQRAFVVTVDVGADGQHKFFLIVEDAAPKQVAKAR